MKLYVSVDVRTITTIVWIIICLRPHICRRKMDYNEVKYLWQLLKQMQQ